MRRWLLAGLLAAGTFHAHAAELADTTDTADSDDDEIAETVILPALPVTHKAPSPTAIATPNPTVTATTTEKPSAAVTVTPPAAATPPPAPATPAPKSTPSVASSGAKKTTPISASATAPTTKNTSSVASIRTPSTATPSSKTEKPTPLASSVPPLQLSQPAPLQLSSAPALPTSDDPNFKVVLKGTLPHSLELRQSDSPVLIKGNFVIPAGCALKINAGVVVALQGDDTLSAPQAGAPDPRAGAVVWIWGVLHIDGLTGNPVELASKTSASNQDASLLFYGAEASRLEGARIKNVSITQTAGTTTWLNCEVVNAHHYALASGISLITQCSFKNCGGLFATYNAGAWSLLVRRSLFENCREGIVLGSDPGETRLIIEKNHFVSARGAHLRILPTTATRASTTRKAEVDILIGENWYGTTVSEEVDLRIVDRRTDPSLRTRLNIRPPSDRPYNNTGAGVSTTVLAASQKEQESMLKRLTQAHPWPKPKSAVGSTATDKSPSTSTASDKAEKAAKSELPETASVNRPIKKGSN